SQRRGKPDKSEGNPAGVADSGSRLTAPASDRKRVSDSDCAPKRDRHRDRKRLSAGLAAWPRAMPGGPQPYGMPGAIARRSYTARNNGGSPMRSDSERMTTRRM